MLLPLFLIDALAAVCLLYPFFSSLSPLLSPIFTSFPLDFLFAGSVSFADSVPQFGIVALLHSQARLQFSLPYWAYYGLFPPLAAAFVRPFTQGSLLDSATPV